VLTDTFEFFAGGGDAICEGFDGIKSFGLGWLRFVLGRHFAKVKLVDNVLPEFLLFKVFDASGECVEAAIGFLFVGSVALMAVFGEEGLGESGLTY
jgi:hypothetical protein